MAGEAEPNGETGRTAGVILLFENGARPSAADIRLALGNLPRASIGFDPAQAGLPDVHSGKPSAETAREDWLELLIDGMTFDLIGLAPGRPLPIPEVAHHYDSGRGSLPLVGEAVGLYAGPHLAEGAHSLPIVRAMLGLAAEFVQVVPGIEAVCWTPARTAIAPRFFLSSVRSWLEGGAFPGLGMMGFAFCDGALRSEGFHFLTGYELALDPALCIDRSAAVRLAVRIAHELVGTQIPEEPVPFETAEAQALVLRPDRAAGIVRIEPM